MVKNRRNSFLGILCTGAVVGSAALALQDDYPFMPPGGRAILSGILTGEEADAIVDAAGREDTVEGWAEWARARNPDLTDDTVQTFAGYAELNFPVSADILTVLGETGDIAQLPLDGKELAVAQCQFCHSLFSSYLMQDRDEAGWRSTFKSPFHSEIPMSEVERETFARYSARNMPLAFEDVPPELRF